MSGADLPFTKSHRYLNGGDCPFRDAGGFLVSDFCDFRNVDAVAGGAIAGIPDIIGVAPDDRSRYKDFDAVGNIANRSAAEVPEPDAFLLIFIDLALASFGIHRSS